MPNFAKCIKRVIDESGTLLARSEVEDVMSLLTEDRGIKGPRAAKDYADMGNEQQKLHDLIEGPPPSAVLTQARDDIVARLRMIAAQQKLNRVQDAIKQRDRFRAYSEAPDSNLGFQAKLIGTNKVFDGHRNSTEASIKGTQFSIVAPFSKELEEGGLSELFASRALETEWVKELGELNRTDQGPRKPVTGNKQALAIAEAIQRMQQRGLEGLRREGAWIGNYDGYVARTTHTADRVRRMGREEWVKLARRTFDTDTIYPNQPAIEIDAALGKQWERIATGEHEKFSPQDLELMQSIPGQNMAKKISESRSIHFKDAAKWLEYIREASDETPTSVIMKSAMRAGRDAGLMKIWGTNPNASFKADMQMLRLKEARNVNEDGGAGMRRFQRNEINFKRWFGLMNGELTTPVNELAARITQNYLALQRTAKLGFLPFAMATHIGTVNGELRYQGVPFFKRITDSVLSFIPAGPVKAEVIKNITSEFYHITGELHSMLEGNDMRVGGRFTRGVSALQNAMFKYTGATFMNETLRKSHIAQMASHFGRLRDSAWADIGGSEQRIMRAFDIAEPEWNALTDYQTKWLKPRGADQAYLTPDAAKGISDRAMTAYAEAKGMQALDANGEARDWRPEELDKMREDLAHKVYAYFADRVDYGAWGHGVGERAILTQGNRPGSALGISLAIMTQYKSFAVFMIRRTMGRDWYGEAGANKISGLLQMVVATGVLGIFQNALTQMLKGQNPESQWRANPTAAAGNALVRGGGLSIVGDYLFSEYNRYDKQGVDWLAGPSAGLINTAIALPHMIKRGEKVRGPILDTIRANMPLANVFYTKLAMDYLVWNGLTEWAHPGYLAASQRRLEKTQGLQSLFTQAPNVWSH